jgi:hypothetical protein
VRVARFRIDYRTAELPRLHQIEYVAAADIWEAIAQVALVVREPVVAVVVELLP